MSFRFILDTREHHITEVFAERSISFLEPKPQLDLGDILITNEPDSASFETDDTKASRLLGSGSSKDEIKSEPQSFSMTLVIERKTFKDLMSSMSDSRYHEQKSRYLQLPRGTVFYILENNDPEFETLGYAQYLGMYVHTMMRDGIMVFITRSIDETVNLLVKMKETVEKFGLNYIDKNPSSVDATQIKKKKAHGSEVYFNQLCCFPGISKTKATAIAEKYKCIKSLIYALNDETFKIKGIGPVLINGMKESLFAVDDDENKHVAEFQLKIEQPLFSIWKRFPPRYQENIRPKIETLKSKFNSDLFMELRTMAIKFLDDYSLCAEGLWNDNFARWVITDMIGVGPLIIKEYKRKMMTPPEIMPLSLNKELELADRFKACYGCKHAYVKKYWDKFLGINIDKQNALIQFLSHNSVDITIPPKKYIKLIEK